MIGKDMYLFFSLSGSNETGAPLFSKVFIDPEALSTEISSEKLKSISIGLSKYTIYSEKDSPIFIIGRSALLSNARTIEKILRTIFKIVSVNKQFSLLILSKTIIIQGKDRKKERHKQC